MQNIRLQFTVPNVERVVNLDVMVNGEKRKLKFRVEAFDWNLPEESTAAQIDKLRGYIQTYDRHWELYHIGTPTEGRIPITFKFKNLG